MRRVFMILATALLAVVPVAVVPAATAYTNPVVMPDGAPDRHDVMSGLRIYTGILDTDNYSKGTVLVEYTDPTYGYQSALVPHNGTTKMCADFADRNSSVFHVTYNPGTPQAVTGTVYYVAFAASVGVTASPQRAHHNVQRARHALHMARRHHRSHARIRSLKRSLRSAKQVLREVMKDYNYCASRQLQ